MAGVISTAIRTAILNVHERELPAPAAAVGALVDGLAQAPDPLWPGERWPPMRLDRPLSVGARGGHGPIRYVVEAHVPGRSVRFRFQAPAGFHGYHEYVVADAGDGAAILRHTLRMRTSGRARLSWPLLYRPLHDALIEDSLDKAARSLGSTVASPARWSRRVRLLRWTAARAGRARSRSRAHT